MDEEFPSIELKLKFQDVDKTMYLFLYLSIFFIISCTFYLYLLILKNLYNIYLTVMYLDEPVRYSDIENNTY